MRVNSTIRIYDTVLRRLNAATVTALEKTGEHLHTEVVQAQVIPFDSGHLQNDSTFVDTSNSKNGSVSIIHSTPYARRLYYHPEYNFDKGENPNAKGKWYEDWLPGGKKENDCAKTFKEFYKQEGGL